MAWRHQVVLTGKVTSATFGTISATLEATFLLQLWGELSFKPHCPSVANQVATVTRPTLERWKVDPDEKIGKVERSKTKKDETRGAGAPQGTVTKWSLSPNGMRFLGYFSHWKWQSLQRLKVEDTRAARHSLIKLNCASRLQRTHAMRMRDATGSFSERVQASESHS